ADAWAGRSGGALSSAERALNVGPHGNQLLVPVTPVMRSVGREVERAVAATRSGVVVPELLIGAQRELLQELGRHAVATQLVRSAVAAVDPDAGVVLHQARNLHHRVVALPGRVTARTPHV